MTHIEMYAADWCPYSNRAKALLDKKGVAYEYIDVDQKEEARQEMRRRGGGHTLPQIFIAGAHIGGSDELHALDRRGELDPLLADAR